MMAICVECRFYQNGSCLNSELPYTNYVIGKRECRHLNCKGDCKGFKAKPKPESIYESPEDEKLAKIHKK